MNLTHVVRIGCRFVKQDNKISEPEAEWNRISLRTQEEVIVVCSVDQNYKQDFLKAYSKFFFSIVACPPQSLFCFIIIIHKMECE